MTNRPQTVKTIDLGYEQLFVLDDGPDTRVRVLFGGTWLTEEGAAGDRIVRAGDEVTLLRHGKALLQALAPARVQIVAAPARGLVQRAASRLRRLGHGASRALQRMQLGERAAVGPNA